MSRVGSAHYECSSITHARARRAVNLTSRVLLLCSARSLDGNDDDDDSVHCATAYVMCAVAEKWII